MPWLRAAMVLNPFTSSVYRAVAVILLQEGRLDEAGRIIRANLKRHPSDPQSHNILGMIMERQEDTGRALNEYRAALNADPHYPEALFNMGYLLFKMGKFEEAQEPLNQAAKFAPELTRSKDEIINLIPKPHPFSPSAED
jgi:Tfp pilus assembly protein PilF